MPLQSKALQVIETQIIYILACFAAMLIFFQANFAFGEFYLNLNLADVFAICGISVAALHIIYDGKLQFRVPYLKLFLFFSSVAMFSALLVGITRYGFTSFAFFNKFIGYFILIGYASLGAVFVSIFGKDGLKLLTNVMTAVVVTIITIKLVINAVYYTGILGPKFIINPILSGYSNNRNAFALQLLTVLCLQLGIFGTRKITTVGVLTAAVCLTYSRSAMITLGCLYVALYSIRLLDLHDIKRVLVGTGTVLVSAFLVESLMLYSGLMLRAWIAARDGAQFIAGFAPGMFSMLNFSPITSDPQRVYTLIEGLKLWLANPFFGAGLGGFVQHEFAKTGEFLVIHNSFVWLLAEFGLINSSVFVWYSFVLLRHLWHSFKTTTVNLWHSQDKILLSMALVFVLMASAHEIFYQRIVWFILGICLTRMHTSVQSAQTNEYCNN